MLIEEIMKEATQAAQKTSPEEKVNRFRTTVQASTVTLTPRPCRECGIQKLSRNRLCDVCDSIFASLTRNSVACEYWKKMDAEFRREVQRVKYLCGMGERDFDEENA
jgi:hypothetical protein